MMKNATTSYKKFFMIFVSIVTVFAFVGCTPPEETPECARDQTLIDNVCVDNEVDSTSPTITGVRNINFTIGEETPDYLDGITASDDIDGDISNDIQLDITAVDLTTAGEYVVTVTVNDSSNNEASETFTITVTEDIPDYAALAALDIAAIDLVETVGVLDAFTKIQLPSFGANGSNLIWSSSNKHIISDTGFVQNPPIGSDPVDVTMMLKVINNSYVEDLEYTITVQPLQEVSVTSSTTVPFDNISDQYDAVDQAAVEIFFVDNGSVPYMDIETYINMMDGVIYSNMINYRTIGDDQLELSYHPTLANFYLFYPEEGALPSTEHEFTALFDFTENTVTFSSYMFFAKLCTTRNPVESQDISVTNVELQDGDEFTISLSEYRSDILIHNDGSKDNYLVPYHVLDLFFTTTVFYNTYYRPEGIIGEAMNWDIDRVALITSEKNGDPIPYDVRVSSYNILLLSMDYFTILKERKEIDSFRDHYSTSAEAVIGSTDSYYYTALANVVRTLDDLKAQASSVGYYHQYPTQSIDITAGLGPRRSEYYRNFDIIVGKFEDKFGNLNTLDDFPTVRYIDSDTTAIFYFYSFNRDMSDEFEQWLEALPVTVENVVLDLTFNRGGNVGAMYRMFGYMTNQPLELNMANKTNGITLTYTIENTLPVYDYNWYITTSGATINSANMFTGMAKAYGFATIIGTQTYGSSSVYDIMTLPCGFIYFLPAYNTVYDVVGNEVDGYTWESIEYGVAPDYVVTDVFNDQNIIDTIAQHQADTSS